MIILFKKQSTDTAASKVVNSLLASKEDDEPVVLRGDQHDTVRMIESLDFEHTFTLGLCAFAPDDDVTPEIEEEVMDRFESTAFAGLDLDQYCILWVRRKSHGRHELHFVVPRVELSTLKSLNIAPPGHNKIFNALCDMINLHMVLPTRGRSLDVELWPSQSARRGQGPRQGESRCLPKKFHGLLYTSAWSSTQIGTRTKLSHAKT